MHTTRSGRRQGRLPALLCLGLAVVLTAACGGDRSDFNPAPVAAAREPINGGAFDATNHYPFVGQISSSADAGCSGELITPLLVLFAQHCTMKYGWDYSVSPPKMIILDNRSGVYSVDFSPDTSASWGQPIHSHA